MAANDPAERFDLCDAEGRPLGRTKSRGRVHRDGDYHRSLHVWVVLRSDPPTLLLQRRGLGKDTWPGAIDVAVGGHLAAGETVADALREADEEIGLALTPNDLVPLGRRRHETRGEGLWDRELQDVFAVVVDRELTSFRPCPGELEAVLAVPLEGARRLLAGDIERATATLWTSGGELLEASFGVGDLVAAEDGYPARVLGILEAILAGRPFAPIVPGPVARASNGLA